MTADRVFSPHRLGAGSLVKYLPSGIEAKGTSPAIGLATHSTMRVPSTLATQPTRNGEQVVDLENEIVERALGRQST